MKAPIKMLSDRPLHLPGDVPRHPRARALPACRALLMTATEHETEGGFGTGLRAQLQAARRGLAAADAKPIPAAGRVAGRVGEARRERDEAPEARGVGETFALSPWAGTHSEIDAMLSPRSAESTPGRERWPRSRVAPSGSCSSPPRRSGGGGAAAPCGATAAHSRGRGTRAGEREADLISSASCRRPIVSAPSPLRSSRSRRRLLRSANARSSVPRPSWLRVRQAGRARRARSRSSRRGRRRSGSVRRPSTSVTVAPRSSGRELAKAEATATARDEQLAARSGASGTPTEPS